LADPTVCMTGLSWNSLAATERCRRSDGLNQAREAHTPVDVATVTVSTHGDTWGKPAIVGLPARTPLRSEHPTTLGSETCGV
jgi:hypothetical protein